MDDGLFAYGAPAPADAGGTGGTLAGNTHESAPLAVRMRPRTLDELVGQQHLLAPGAPLRRLVAAVPVPDPAEQRRRREERDRLLEEAGVS